MRSDPEIGAGFPGTQEDKASLAVFGIVLFRIGVIDLTAVLQAPCTRQAITLMTQGRQDNSGFESRIPEVLIRPYLDALRFIVVKQFDLKEVSVGHISKVFLPLRASQVG